jgi:biotin synthase-related radical SAM superfamily protein
MPMDLETKAYLLSVGTIDASPPQSKDRTKGRRSTSGPGAGGQSIFFWSGERMVRLSVASGSPLRLDWRDEGVAILRGDEVIARGELVEPLSHCPEQAYITISERCIYDCKFCAVPKLMGGVKPLDEILGIVEAAKSSGRLKAISLTSGVEVSPENEAIRAAAVTRALRKFEVPIGVSICPTPGSSELLMKAGASEVKYNIETLDQELFKRVCPGMSLEGIMDGLRDGVRWFGRGKVFSNVIVGLGESDNVLRSGIDELVEMGVLPVLRAVYPHPLRVGEAEMTRPSAERLLALANHLQRAMDKQGLRGDSAETMCYRCTGCDLVPHRDL